MTSSQESKLPFLILIPFLIVVYLFASNSGTPTNPQMPGVEQPQKAQLKDKVDLSAELEAVEAETVDSEAVENDKGAEAAEAEAWD